MKLLPIIILFLGLFASREGRGQGAWSEDSVTGFTQTGGAGSCVLDGKIYVIGGTLNPIFGNGEIQNLLQIFDPLTHLWTTGPDLPKATSYFGCAILNGKIYAFGGMMGVEYADGNIVQVFDTSSKTWSMGNVMPAARYFANSEAVNGKIYLIGGYGDSSNTPFTTVSVYNPSLNTWDTAAPMPEGRIDFGSCVCNGKIYVIGGFEGAEYSGPLATVEIFDPSANTWTAGTPLPSGLSDCSASVLDGKIYVMGDADFSQTLDFFDTETNTWSGGPNMPTGRGDLASEAVNGKIYAIGGLDLGTEDAVAANEVFTPGTSGVTQPEPISSALQVYPNPATNTLNIGGAAGTVTILDPLGRSYAVPRNSNSLDVSSLPAGIYFIVARAQSAKFVKQ